jgi:hypothetical protein
MGVLMGISWDFMGVDRDLVVSYEWECNISNGG